MKAFKNWLIIVGIMGVVLVFLLFSSGMAATSIPNPVSGAPYTSTSFASNFFGVMFSVICFVGPGLFLLLAAIAWVYK